MKTEEFYDEKYRKESEKLQSFKLKALEYLPVNKSYHILDLGCGTGEMATRMQAMGHVVQGIDISSEAIQKLEQKGIKGMAMDLNKGIPFKDESFDVVCLTEVLEHLILPENILKEIYRVLRPDSRLILTVPNSAFFIWRIFHLFGKTCSDVQHSYHLHFFSKRSIEKLLKKENFIIEEFIGRNIFILLPAKWIRPFWFLGKLLLRLGFRKIWSKKLNDSLYLLERFSKRFIAFFADDFIIKAKKQV